MFCAQVVAAIAQYGVLLYIDRQYNIRRHKISSDHKSSAKNRMIEETKRFIQKIDRWSFALFPLISMSLATFYWIYYLEKYMGQ